MRRALLGVAAAVALGLLTPAAATAHPMRLGVLQLEALDGEGVQVRFRYSGTEREPTGVTPTLAAPCAQVGSPEVSPLPYGEERRFVARCPGGLDGVRVSLADVPAGGVHVVVRARFASGARLEDTLDAAQPSVTLREARIDAGAGAVMTRYLALGLEHIAGGVDHLLFVLGLLLLVRELRPAVLTLSAFTVGHSLTLALAALDLVRLPSGPVEAVIALSILLLAVELGLRERGAPPTLTQRYPWAIALLFGLVHGLGFAGALREVGLPSGAVGPALLGFNLGVELGQLALAALALGTAHLALRGRSPGAWARRAPEYLLGVGATFFLLDRLGALM